MPAWARPFVDLLSATWILARTRGGAVALAALAPFLLSHVVVMQARRVGLPERLVLDAVHGVIVLGYLGALLRVARQEAAGLACFGFALPRLSWPGFAPLLAMAAVIAAIGLPAALALHPVVEAIEAAQGPQGLGGAYFPATMLPEFVMTTLIGLVIAAQRSKTPGGRPA